MPAWSAGIRVRAVLLRIDPRDARLEAMKIFVKAVITGFGLSLGSALFKKVQHHLGLGEDNGKAPEAIKQDGATDPNLQQRFS
jgi:hypothetical protein